MSKNVSLFHAALAEIQRVCPFVTLDLEPPSEAYEASAMARSARDLAFPIHVNLQNGDEFWFTCGDFFVGSYFPCGWVRDDFVQDVVGVLKGRYRIVAFTRRGRTVTSRLQAPGKRGRWRTLRSYGRGLLPTRIGARAEVYQDPCRLTMQ